MESLPIVRYTHVMMVSNINVFQVDLLLESGEYFLSNKKKLEKKWQEKQDKQAEKTVESKRKREAAFVPPEVRCS